MAVRAHRSGFCAIVGLPNAGKSTFLNRVLGRRLVAVSRKPQTTRNRILGVKNLEEPDPAQIVFVDTPGVQRGRGPLGRFMREETMSAAGEGDACLLVVDCGDRSQRTVELLQNGPAKSFLDHIGRKPAVVAINKVDRLKDKAALLPMIESYSRLGPVVPISAANGDGIDGVVAEVVARLPEGPPLFPNDMVTDRAERFLAAELIREQLFRQLGDELPYASAVRVEAFEDREDKNDVVLDAAVFVERDSQKGIVVGKGGSRIKDIGKKAREAISELFGCPVHLRLHVKVAKDWSQGDRGLRDMGYDT